MEEFMKEHLTIKSNFDQLPLDVVIMSPPHPIGIVQFSHGMCEHKERYFDFMNFLVKNGYVCLIHDHRGHGKSIFKEEDLGYFYDQGHLGIVEDVHQLTLLMKQRYPELPLYLFGHSMGSLVVRCYTKKYDQDIDGLIVCGSPSLNPAAGMGIHLARISAKLSGDHHRPKLIQKIGFDAFNKNFDKKTPNSWICSDSKVVQAYNQNPLCRFIFTANGFESLFHLMKETYNPQNWVMKKEELPIYFVAGKEDPCIVSEKKFQEAVQFMKDRGYHHVSSHLFANMRHEILNEKNHQQVYEYLLNILKSWE